MSDWQRFELYPWNATKRYKHGLRRRYGADGYIVIEPRAYSGAALHAIWYFGNNNPLCCKVGEGNSFAELKRQAEEWIAENEKRKAEREVVP